MSIWSITIRQDNKEIFTKSVDEDDGTLPPNLYDAKYRRWKAIGKLVTCLRQFEQLFD